MSIKRHCAVAIVVLLALGLRFGAITFDSFWLDEAYQSMFDAFGVHLPFFMHFRGEPVLVKFLHPQSLSSVLSVLRDVDSLGPPLYPVLLNQWMSAFGVTDLSIRSMSAVLSTLSVLALYMVSTWSFGSGPAIFSALLQAISPFDVAYGQEARMYSLESLSAVLSFGSFFKIFCFQKRNRRFVANLVLYVLATWAMVNSHYTALAALVSQILFALVICARRRNAELFGCMMVSWALIALIWWPWLDYFVQAVTISQDKTSYVERANSWWWPLWALFVRVPINWTCFLAGKRVTVAAIPVYITSPILIGIGFWRAFASVLGNAGKRTAVGAVVQPGNGTAVGAAGQPENGTAPGAGIAVDACAGDSAEDARQRNKRFMCLSLLYWALVPTILLWCSDCIGGRRVIEVTRYLIFTAPAAYMLGGNALVWLSHRRKAFLTIFCLHCLCCFINLTFIHMVWQQRPWRQIAAQVSNMVAPDDIVMVSHHFDIVCLDRYLDHPLRQVALSPNMGADEIAKVFKEFFPDLKQFWLVSSESGDLITSMLPPQYKVVQQIDYPHNLHLRRYRME